MVNTQLKVGLQKYNIKKKPKHNLQQEEKHVNLNKYNAYLSWITTPTNANWGQEWLTIQSKSSHSNNTGGVG